MLLILFITHILPVVSDPDKLYSATIRDNKLIAIYNTGYRFYVKVRVFELKEGTTVDIYNSVKTYYFGCPDSNFALIMLDAPEHLPEVKNRIWIKFKLVKYINNPTKSPLMGWVGYIDLNDMSFKNDSSFIRFPTHESFPVSGYTMNTITNEFGSALYITGGELYSKKDNSYSASNSFYKYNFTSKEWKDITYSGNGKLKPLFDHKSVVINNRYLVILGGKREIIYNSTYKFSDQYRSFLKYDSLYEYNSLYNLSKFDTYSNSWENLNIKADILDTNIPTFQFDNFIAASLKDKIFVLSGVTRENRTNNFDENGYFGTLELKSKSWYWSPIIDGNRIISREFLILQDPEVFNNQLIICTSFPGSYLPIHIYDITSKKMRSKLRYSNSSNYSDSIEEKYEYQIYPINIPNHAIVYIAASCTLVLGILIYLLYRKVKNSSIFKNGKNKSNEPIREVWANPDIYNTNNIIKFEENSSSIALYSNDLYQKPENLNISNKIEFGK
ncbi:hypothetical protein CONCODRAFT_13440 [Conidiobolus coronatus NRRL 28638]|uniref:Galactose oxidase n=1 Tax=Conidiobolus coronatus (strain ATCC 28846 / CBS 209.66 / NRRL 28638) TaxID=796925 RepID=A0A137NQP9_CONC2|nr:hypothetical protein CONCODRAFT_13440 [Conidiobolus coronatus NRRL 28638]|eukprot:KXN65095.1 hypothetical protein CONCODRAFT_13440 [Conidiobolus coronatus NRRL 28638]